jgi:outer membrane protein assembly factor BamB
MRKLAIGLSCVAVGVAVAYGLGVRVSVDGSGKWPRFISLGPDFDALEAERAGQRESLPPIVTPLQDGDVAVSQPASDRPSSELSALPPEPSPAAPATPRPTAVALPRSGYWPSFRGPNQDGRYDEGPIRTDWPRDGLQPLWRHPIGLGYASFVVADGRAFTIEQRRRQEVVAAYDVDTGREMWTNGWDTEFKEFQGGDGPRATPAYHDGRIYALGASGELRCLNAASGALVWRRNILEDNGADNLPWGMAAAPLIVDDKVIVLPGGDRGRSVVAYHRDTGEPIWKALDDRQAYVSPVLATLGGVRQVIIVSANRAMGIAPEDGRLLWEHPWATSMGINAAQPLVVGADRIFLSASYGHGAALVEVQRDGDRFTTRTVWENQRMKNKFNSSVFHDGFIYGLDESILACLDATTGELKWKAGRYGYGQLVLAGNHLVVLTEDGEVVLVHATPDRHDELARFQAVRDKTWNHPVIVNGRLLVRNIREMAAFEIGQKN